jgi:hypothetical protein
MAPPARMALRCVLGVVAPCPADLARITRPLVSRPCQKIVKTRRNRVAT